MTEFDRLKKLAAAEVENVLHQLPKQLRDKAERVAVTFQARPNKAQLGDGIEGDTLGLFVGPPWEEQETTTFPVPPQIILFLENLWDFAEDDEEIFQDEVRTTLMHELGHYLGLDEDDLFDRGLD